MIRLSNMKKESKKKPIGRPKERKSVISQDNIVIAMHEINNRNASVKLAYFHRVLYRFDK
jgi:hypothetical protein